MTLRLSTSNLTSPYGRDYTEVRNRGIMSLLFLLLGCTTKAWESPIDPIVGIANIDDDNQDGRADWDGDVSDAENDFTTFELPQK